MFMLGLMAGIVIGAGAVLSLAFYLGKQKQQQHRISAAVRLSANAAMDVWNARLMREALEKYEGRA
jgi:hypothetical protein